MNTTPCCAALVALVSSLAFVPARVIAAAPATPAPVSPSPVPSPGIGSSPDGSASADDPCTSLSNLVSRPSVTTSACVVKPGDLLVESGFSNTTSNGPGATSLVSVPQALLRVGVARNFEVDFSAPSYQRQSTSPESAGESDSGIGFKYELSSTNRITYGVNLLYTLDNGSPQFSANGNGVLVNADAALAMSPALGLFTSVGYNSQSAGTPIVPQRYDGFDPSLGASLSLPLGLSVYLEGFGMSSFEPGSSGKYGFDAGVTGDIGRRLQVDAEYYDYPSLHDGAHQSAIGFGASYLFGP